MTHWRQTIYVLRKTCQSVLRAMRALKNILCWLKRFCVSFAFFLNVCVVQLSFRVFSERLRIRQVKCSFVYLTVYQPTLYLYILWCGFIIFFKYWVIFIFTWTNTFLLCNYLNLNILYVYFRSFSYISISYICLFCCIRLTKGTGHIQHLLFALTEYIVKSKPSSRYFRATFW